MRNIDITDFSGGIHEAYAPSDFTDRQSTQLKGFFLKDETRIQSQWPLQTIGSEVGFREIRPLTAYDGTKYLIGIKLNNEIWQATVPANSALYGTANSTSWTRITSSNGVSTLTVTDDSHFLTDITFQNSAIASNKKIPGLLIGRTIATADNTSPIVIWADTSASIGAYRIQRTLVSTVTNRQISTLVARLTFSTFHQFKVGDTVTVAGVATDYNGSRVITVADDLYIEFATAGANEASTVSTGTVTGDTATVYPGYLPATPSSVTLTQVSGNVQVAWVVGLSGSSPITGYNIYDNFGTLKTTAAANATSATFAGLVANGAIVLPVNSYGETPFAAAGGSIVPAIGYVPRSNVAALWSGQLILADIEYYKDQADIDKSLPLTPRNSQRLRNGIWFSNPDAPTQFDPLAVFTLGNPDSIITGMVVIPQGLVVFTTTQSKETGIYLLRGTSAGVVLESELALNFTAELIRGGMSTPNGSINPGQTLSLWPTVGTVVFLDDKSLVYQTNTQDVLQLDQYGVTPPTQYSSTDSIVTWDRYLFVSRAGRLLCMREFGSDGSWTELALPGDINASSLCVIGNALYFIANDGSGYKVWRFNLYPVSTAANEYGQSNGTNLDLTITTRPVGEPNRYEKQSWHRIGMRARGAAVGTPTLKSITSLAGSPLVGTPISYTTTFSPAKVVTPRFEVVVPAHGPSIEACARIIVTGLVEIEAVNFYVHGKKPQRV